MKSTIAKLCRMVAKLPQPFPARPTNYNDHAAYEAAEAVYEEAMEPVYKAAYACKVAYGEGVVGYTTLSDIAYEILLEEDAKTFCQEIVFRLEDGDVEIRTDDYILLGFYDEESSERLGACKLAIYSRDLYLKAVGQPYDGVVNETV